MKSIYKIIRDCENDFLYKPVKVAEGYSFNQAATLKRINLYSAGQFLDGNTTEDGLEKVFFDVTTPAVSNFAKNIDLDTKDVQFRAINGTDYFKSWIYRRKARQWMRDHGFAEKINEIPDDLCTYGTVVLKKVSGPEVFKSVDLRNLINDPSAKCLEDGWAIEKLYFTPDELVLMKSRGWDSEAIDKAVNDFATHRSENYVGDGKNSSQEYGEAQYICVREYRGFVPKGTLDGTNDTVPVRAQFAVILPEETDGDGAKSDTKKEREGLLLFKSKIKKSGYKEIHLRRIKGRWLGRGIYEECFPAQEVKNMQINWTLFAMNLSQLILFWTRNKTAAANVTTDLKNGDILKFTAEDKDDLHRIDTQIKDNASSNIMASEVQQLIASLTNSYEVTTGQNLPSNTPFSLGALQNQNADKLFDRVREKFGIVLAEVIEEWLLPELEKEMLKEGIFEITDSEDLKFVRESYTKATVWQQMKHFLMRAKIPTIEEVMAVEGFVTERINAQKSLFLNLSNGFLNYEKKVEVVITDERESVSMIQTLTTILQALGQNPQVAELPVFQMILDRVGLSKRDVAMPIQAAPQTTNA